MKKITFKFRNSEFYIEVDGKKITYIDKYHKEDLVSQMNCAELAEYDMAKSEDDLVEICKKDCILKGFTFVKVEDK